MPLFDYNDDVSSTQEFMHTFKLVDLAPNAPVGRAFTFNWSANSFKWLPVRIFFSVQSEFSVQSTTKVFSYGYPLPDQSEVSALLARRNASHNRHSYVCRLIFGHFVNQKQTEFSHIFHIFQ